MVSWAEVAGPCRLGVRTRTEIYTCMGTWGMKEVEGPKCHHYPAPKEKALSNQKDKMPAHCYLVNPLKGGHGGRNRLTSTI